MVAYGISIVMVESVFPDVLLWWLMEYQLLLWLNFTKPFRDDYISVSVRVQHLFVDIIVITFQVSWMEINV